MLDNPWNAPPRPNADDPGYRTVIPMRPIDMAVNVRDDETRRAIEARLQAVRHVRIESVRRSLFDEVREHPLAPIIAGVIVGMAAVLVPALVVGVFL